MKHPTRHPACEVCCAHRTCPLGWITESICAQMDTRPRRAEEEPAITYGPADPEQCYEPEQNPLFIEPPTKIPTPADGFYPQPWWIHREQLEHDLDAGLEVQA